MATSINLNPPTCYVVVLVYFATAEGHGRYKRVYDNWRDASAHLHGLRRRAQSGDCEVWAYAEGGGLAQVLRLRPGLRVY